MVCSLTYILLFSEYEKVGDAFGVVNKYLRQMRKQCEHVQCVCEQQQQQLQAKRAYKNGGGE